MTILMKIKSDLLEARKSDNLVRKNLLTALFSETAMLGKNKGNRTPEEMSDDETIAVIKKFIKGAEESYHLYYNSGRTDRADVATEELEILNQYLPEQLSEEFLENFVREFLVKSPQSGKQVIGAIMKELNQNYQGRFDGRKANEVISRLISN